jgi:hypothetical protein
VLLKISPVIQSITISEACTGSLKQGLTSDNQDACCKQYREYFKYSITKIALQQYILVFCKEIHLALIYLQMATMPYPLKCHPYGTWGRAVWMFGN